MTVLSASFARTIKKNAIRSCRRRSWRECWDGIAQACTRIASGGDPAVDREQLLDQRHRDRFIKRGRPEVHHRAEATRPRGLLGPNRLLARRPMLATSGVITDDATSAGIRSRLLELR